MFPGFRVLVAIDQHYSSHEVARELVRAAGKLQCEVQVDYCGSPMWAGPVSDPVHVESRWRKETEKH